LLILFEIILFLGAPKKILAIYPTDNSFTGGDVKNRWKFFKNEMEKEDLIPLFSTDAFSSFLMAMKSVTSFGKQFFHQGLSVPLFCDISTAMKVMQDPPHFLNKFRNQLIERLLKIGAKLASINHLKILVNNENISKNDHLLNKSDIGTHDQSADKMNAKSTEKICSQKVIELLKQHVVGSEGTAAYLQIMRYLFDAFLEPTSTPLDRLYKAFVALIFIRVWRNNLEKKDSDFFITTQLWTCLELNCAFLYDLVVNGNGHLILVWNSQTCEETFRTLRSMTTHNLTQINFNLLEAFQKINRIEKIQELSHDLRDTFILEENLKLKSDVQSQLKIPISSPTLEECHFAISKAEKDAILICKNLQMKKLFPCNPEQYMKQKKSKNARQVHQEDDGDDDEEEQEDLEIPEPITLDGNVDNLTYAEKKILKVKNLHFLDEISGI
jgi:hypothetical protein